MGLPCGHDSSLAIVSAEDGRFLYCDLCNTREERNDAVMMEKQLRADLAAAQAEVTAWKFMIKEYLLMSPKITLWGDSGDSRYNWIERRVAELLKEGRK